MTKLCYSRFWVDIKLQARQVLDVPVLVLRDSGLYEILVILGITFDGFDNAYANGPFSRGTKKLAARSVVSH